MKNPWGKVRNRNVDGMKLQREVEYKERHSGQIKVKDKYRERKIKFKAKAMPY